MWPSPKCTVFLMFSVRREQKKSGAAVNLRLRKIRVPCFLSVKELFNSHPLQSGMFLFFQGFAAHSLGTS